MPTMETVATTLIANTFFVCFVSVFIGFCGLIYKAGTWFLELFILIFSVTCNSWGREAYNKKNFWVIHPLSTARSRIKHIGNLSLVGEKSSFQMVTGKNYRSGWRTCGPSDVVRLKFPTAPAELPVVRDNGSQGQPISFCHPRWNGNVLHLTLRCPIWKGSIIDHPISCSSISPAIQLAGRSCYKQLVGAIPIQKSTE